MPTINVITEFIGAIPQREQITYASELEVHQLRSENRRIDATLSGLQRDVATRVEYLDSRLGQLDSLESSVSSLQQEIRSVRERTDRLDRRVARIASTFEGLTEALSSWATLIQQTVVHTNNIELTMEKCRETVSRQSDQTHDAWERLNQTQRQLSAQAQTIAATVNSMTEALQETIKHHGVEELQKLETLGKNIDKVGQELQSGLAGVKRTWANLGDLTRQAAQDSLALFRDILHLDRDKLVDLENIDGQLNTGLNAVETVVASDEKKILLEQHAALQQHAINLVRAAATDCSVELSDSRADKGTRALLDALAPSLSTRVNDNRSNVNKETSTLEHAPDTIELRNVARYLLNLSEAGEGEPDATPTNPTQPITELIRASSQLRDGCFMNAIKVLTNASAQRFRHPLKDALLACLLPQEATSEKSVVQKQ